LFGNDETLLEIDASRWFWFAARTQRAWERIQAMAATAGVTWEFRSDE
jgi:hypothetical protein